MDDLIISDQKYVSSKRAAEITGYAKDYIGQLCREGRVEARLVGRSWYVREAAIRDHRFGPENAPLERVILNNDSESVDNRFESTKYVADDVPPLPLSNVTTADVGDSSISGTNDSLNTATQMQEAWQDWFAENRSEGEPETIPINKIHDEPRREPMFQNAILDDVVSDQRFENHEAEPPINSPKNEYEALSVRKHLLSWSKITLVLVIVVISAVYVSIGVGFADDLKIGGQTATVIRYISGTNILNK